MRYKCRAHERRAVQCFLVVQKPSENNTILFLAEKKIKRANHVHCLSDMNEPFTLFLILQKSQIRQFQTKCLSGNFETDSLQIMIMINRHTNSTDMRLKRTLFTIRIHIYRGEILFSLVCVLYNETNMEQQCKGASEDGERETLDSHRKECVRFSTFEK